ncbi:DNA alkylation repair protein [Chloroflexota bacterium]
MNYGDVINKLKSLSDPVAVVGMARFGINPESTLGISIPPLRKLAKGIGKDSILAGQLWASGIHEARILAGMVDDPNKVTEEQMDRWAQDFDSWDVCDQCCMNLFDKTRFAYDKAVEWSSKEKEFVKRAGFALMACLAWHDKKVDDRKFDRFFPVIEREAWDSRNFVKKAVNWALRQIGKRSPDLNEKAVQTARRIQEQDSKSARWIAADAIRELTGPAVRERLNIARGLKGAEPL